MKIAKMNKRVMIQRRAEVQSDTGAMDETYVDFQELWAAIIPLSVREALNAQQKYGEVTTRIELRYNDLINSKMRVKYVRLKGSPTEFDLYAIEGPPLHILEGRRETHLMCRKIEAEGNVVAGTVI